MNRVSLGRRLKYALRDRRPRSCKIDETIVAAIKRDLANGMTQRGAASKYHLAKGTISSIASGLTWGSVAPCGNSLPTA